MLNDRLRLRVPDRCRFCESLNCVKLEQTIKGDLVLLAWCCTKCGAEWPTTPVDEQR